ncbi:winged helix-turn-helix domain-containing protein [Spirilliplanes yamanashiensis]|uniref:OmpR/PhoB-type domain-containing protein n=1 Tax=Spirilliplanes yamanashiensis TaxID=42233 RepID=A0A8J4DIJ1_9ACTN|nr:winged helix-turn-helix domain-containing protein [Spirilliplanes yamanashiensis]MDP9819166.1 hypothetical protein [Spirilliplanes yamanashiensis]GIJ02010.1 hypothetical protein Sya03_13620 [Spirilliplanes yamanashiensis]
MSAAAVTDLAPARRTQRPGTRPRGTAPARLRPVPTPAAERSVTVTVRVAPGAENDGVLAALRELIAVAGTTGDVSAAPAAAPAAPAASPVHLELHPATRVVTRGGEALTLSRLEYDLLLFLAENPRRVFSRTQLLNQVWGHTHTSARTVDVHVSRLRTKLGETPDLITTVYGIGYRLADDAAVTVVR